MARASRRNPRPGAAFTSIAVIARPLLAILCKRDWHGRENVPRQGGLIVVANHVTYFDPLSIGHFLVKSGRTPRFLAKASVFKTPVLGKLIRAAGQIPVHRESRDAALAFREAVKAVQRGETIIVYPEGTMTKDPDLWPMAGKTGAARIALRTGAPVLPIGQWGAQEVLPHYSTKPQFFPRKTLKVTAGEPIDLRAAVGTEINSEALRKGTELIMDRITELVAGVRGEQPPAVRFDPAATRAGDESTAPAQAASEEEASDVAAPAVTGPDVTPPDSAAPEESDPVQTPASASTSTPTPEARA
ncbi:MAG TPA: 1-acyl-sn-glycerol-3-phosphate acyltransferase [Actinocrinis sp.]|uniref:lysophospholipid acyltransferase family protein n=1 Tax=Actinocrinis sp. TaxID=1920516 RepID=UPI002DDDABE1|nr:1-acyl-sn-glycerol-3-phosphate acyltransferase [Actinocrinis sp.]HEV3172812.1 1-acyl-sn-glycerol-3-phosphate acyltransferase [Actinocrinis sp.]